MKEKAGALKTLKRWLRAAVFNPKWRCAVCGEENFTQGFLCETCEAAIPRLSREKTCAHCGRKTRVAEAYCFTCKNNLVSTEKMRSVFDYSGEVPRLISAFKYKGKKWLRLFFAEELAALYRESGLTADLVTFVPAFAADERARGYNQSKLLAEEFAKITGLPVEPLFTKTKPTAHQAGLTRKERLKNLAGAFRRVKGANAKGKTVLLIDDVTTTGATAETLAAKCLKGGAKAVLLFTVASVHDRRYDTAERGPKSEFAKE